MVDLNYRIDGSGPRVLLLHAVGMDLTLLDALAATMAQDFTVLRADLRGHGTSPYAPARFACRPEATLLTLVSDVSNAYLELLEGTGLAWAAVALIAEPLVSVRVHPLAETARLSLTEALTWRTQMLLSYKASAPMGDFEHDLTDLERGSVLVTPDAWHHTPVLDVRLSSPDGAAPRLGRFRRLRLE